MMRIQWVTVEELSSYYPDAPASIAINRAELSLTESRREGKMARRPNGDDVGRHTD